MRCWKVPSSRILVSRPMTTAMEPGPVMPGSASGKKAGLLYCALATSETSALPYSMPWPSRAMIMPPATRMAP